MGEQLQQLNRFIQFRVRLSMTLEVRSVEVCQFVGAFFLVSHRIERQQKLSNFSLTFLSYDIHILFMKNQQYTLHNINSLFTAS
jgi:hypothetical protein